MLKRTYSDIPPSYAVCEHADCPKAATCLHQIAYGKLIATEDYLRLLNPQRTPASEDCPHYRDSQPVVYARGFTGMQKRMFPDQYQRFMIFLMGCFSRNGYFERRRGDTPLSPKEQQLVLQALRQAGVTEELPFDKYEENTNWYD